MLVKCYHPQREFTLSGPRTVGMLLKMLNLPLESVLVIRDDILVTEDDRLTDQDTIEIRPVISGGSAEVAVAV